MVINLAPKPPTIKILERDDLADFLALLPLNTIFTAGIYFIASRLLQKFGTVPNIFGEGLDWYIILTKENPGLILGAVISQITEFAAFDAITQALEETGSYTAEQLEEHPVQLAIALFVSSFKKVTGL